MSALPQPVIDFRPTGNLRFRRMKSNLFAALCVVAVTFALAMLVSLLGKVWADGHSRLSMEFFQRHTSGLPQMAGIKGALLGTVWVIVLTALIAVPVGVAAAVFLEEFNLRRNRFTEFIQVNISNLAGVPSIVYGLLGLALFVRTMGMGRSVLAGALTMALLILPMIIIVTQEALRAVPRSYREGSYALGASLWQTIRRQVLPAAVPGILTGIILSVSRAIGETAPLITIGAASFIAFTPSKVTDPFTVLPIQIYNWTSRPEKEFAEVAAAAIIVLMAVLILLNSVTLVIRARAKRHG